MANESSDTEATSNAGSLLFTDAGIVCLPVRSFYGTFAWITSPLALEKLGRSLSTAIALPDVPGTGGAAVCTGSDICSPTDKKIYLEDIDVAAKEDSNTDKWADFIAGSVFADKPNWQDIFKERFAVTDNNTFTFLCEAGTEVNARIRINDETKMVNDGALWYEESLPIETILSGVVWCDKVYAKDISPQNLMDKFCTEELKMQIGGKASTGKGLVRCLFTGGE